MFSIKHCDFANSSKIFLGKLLVASNMLKCTLAMDFSDGAGGKESACQETGALSLGREDPLDKGMAIHSSVLAWRIPWAEKPVGLQSMGSQRVGHD